MKKIYSDLTELIKENLDTPETKEALNLIKELKDVKIKGFLSQKQFYDVVMWKTPKTKKALFIKFRRTNKRIIKKSLIIKF